MCSSALENVPYSLENYTLKTEQFDQLKLFKFVKPKKYIYISNILSRIFFFFLGVTN